MSKWELTMATVANLTSDKIRIHFNYSRDDPICFRFRLTWIAFILGSHSSLASTIVNWINEATGHSDSADPDFLVVATHGAILLLTLIDGTCMILNRIPLRLMHWYGIILPHNLANTICGH